MKVIYQKGVSDHLNEVIARAALERREIEYIHLTPPEWHQLERELRHQMFIKRQDYTQGDDGEDAWFVSSYKGVEIRSRHERMG